VAREAAMITVRKLCHSTTERKEDEADVARE
jgi:hypothetical protein